jgi:glycerophosphoryl diester phosphodiesterase
MSVWKIPLAGAALVAIIFAATLAHAVDVTPLPRAHAHNDYEHDRPLLDALEHGFCSIEADIWLVDGALLVAHDRDKVDPARTLDALYLQPLEERAKKNGGRVYPGGPEVTLLIDIKSDAEATYVVLRDLLANYADMLTTFEGDDVTERAVRVIISGARPRATMEAETLHYAAYDGRLDDLGGGASAAFMPLVSSSWPGTFKWQGRGPMPEDERAKLKAIVNQAHAEGRKVRFWAIAHREELWQELYEAGVDLINADNLDQLRAFLLQKRAERGE